MSTPLFTPGDEKQDEKLNPGQQDYDRRFSGLSDAEQRGTVNTGDEDSLKNDEADPSTAQESARKREASGAVGAPSGGWRNMTTVGEKKKTKIRGLNPAKKYWPVIGIGGGIGIVALLFLALMPLKLNMFVSNITKIASEIPGYAVERRTEYIATRLLAIHLINKSSGISGTDADKASKAVFCKNASISCSLVSTYGANYFDNLIDVSIGERFGDNVRITITPKGQTQLGGSARSWSVDIARDLGDEQVLRTTKVLQSNAEAKAYLKNMVNKNLKTKSITTRYLARAILMKKYGITHWRAFEKTSNKIDENKTKIKTAIIKNTVGKVSNRMSLYLGCFQNSSVCESLKDGLSTQANDLQEKIDNPNTSAQDKERFKAQKQALDKLSGDKPLSDEDLAGGTAKQIIIKRLMLAAGVAGAIGTIDMIFNAVEAVDNGALEQVSADMAKVAYVGFAFGDETGIVPNVERIMAGDGDMEVYGELTSLLDGAEQSPLMQYENGLIAEGDVASSSYKRTCNINDKQQEITLEKGQLVCPERTVGRDYSSLLTTNPAWETLASTAKAWNGSIGLVVGAISGFIGNLPIISQVGELVSELSKPAMEWAMSLFFTPPPTGYETTGQNNYDSLSGAIRTTQNELMEEGVSESGEAYGAGGSVLTSAEVSAITGEVRADELEDYNNESSLAKLFNPGLSGSFAQHFIAAVPTSFSGLVALPSQTFSSFITNTTPSTSAYATTTVNPFNIPIYGYASGDPALEADPSVYTEESCKASAQAREDSYTREESRSTLPTYGVSDPCALEKMVVGSMLQAQGVTDDPYSLKEPGAESTSAGAGTNANTSTNTGRPANTTNRGKGWSTTPGADYTATACDPRTKEVGIFTTITNGAKVRICQVYNAEKYPSLSIDNNPTTVAVASIISTNTVNMFEAAYADGVTLGIGSGFRPASEFEHSKGLAMDIGSPIGGKTICFIEGGSKIVWDACNNGTYSNPQHVKAFAWLNANGEKYGFYNLAGTPIWEPWHWSTSGY